MALITFWKRALHLCVYCIMYVCTYMYFYICLCLYSYTWVCIYGYMHIYVYMHICMHICICAYMYMCISYVYIYLYKLTSKATFPFRLHSPIKTLDVTFFQLRCQCTTKPQRKLSNVSCAKREKQVVVRESMVKNDPWYLCASGPHVRHVRLQMVRLNS